MFRESSFPGWIINLVFPLNNRKKLFAQRLNIDSLIFIICRSPFRSDQDSSVVYCKSGTVVGRVVWNSRTGEHQPWLGRCRPNKSSECNRFDRWVQSMKFITFALALGCSTHQPFFFSFNIWTFLPPFTDNQ